MKKVFLTLLLAVFVSSFGQTRLTINQDARLAFYGDDKGNNSYTPNLTFRFTQFFINNNYFRPLTLVEYEIADLEGGLYARMGIGVGFNVPLTKYMEGQFQFSSGYINRNGRSYASPEMVGNLSFKITDNVSLLLEGQRTIRNDLKGQPVIYSGKIGLRIQIFNKPCFEN